MQSGIPRIPMKPVRRHSLILPAAPTGLTVSTPSTTQINLLWTDNSSNETGFKIERKTGAGGTYAQIATVGASVTSYSNTGLTPGTTYFYRVRATNASGDSAYSNEASTTTLTTIWPDSATPASPDTLDGVPSTEVGVRFKSDRAGWIRPYAFTKGRATPASILVTFGRILELCSRRSPSRTKRLPVGSERICQLQSPLPPEPRTLPPVSSNLSISLPISAISPGRATISRRYTRWQMVSQDQTESGTITRALFLRIPTTPLIFGLMSSLAILRIRAADVGKAHTLALRSK